MDPVMLDDQIGRAYSGFALQAIYDQYLESFIKGHPGIFRGNLFDSRSLSRVSVPKKTVIKALAILFSEPSSLKLWLASLPDVVNLALETVAWEGRMMVEELEGRIGCSMMKASRGGAERNMVLSAFCLFQLKPFKSFWGAEGNTNYLDLPPLLRSRMMDVLTPPGELTLAELIPSSTLVSDFKDKDRILKALPLLIRFLKQGELEVTQQGFPKARSLMRLRDICELEEFYDRHLPAELSCMRMRMVLDVVSGFRSDKEPESDLFLLKSVLDRYLALPVYPHDWFFSHVRGLAHCRDQLNHRLHCMGWELIGALPEKRWITVQQIFRFVQLKGIEFQPISLQSADRYLYFTGDWQGWGSKKRYITPQHYNGVLVIPALKATLFLFASLGILDLVYGKPENHELRSSGKDYLSVFDGLAAVRLTGLGAFVTGRHAMPDPVMVEERLDYELDTERLLIKCSRSDSLADLAMAPFAEKIASMRYRVDAAGFLKGCSTVADLQAKIDRFKKEVGGPLPAVWQVFFNRLISQAGVVQPVDDIQVFKLAVENHEDLDLIANDRLLKQLMLKAEGRHILVNSSDFQRLKKRLAELGYLL